MSCEEVVAMPNTAADDRSQTTGTDDEEFHVMHLEPRPFRPFKTSEEYLYAMKEDLAEWLKTLYDIDITVDDFLERLETGVILCQHANNVLRMAREWHEAGRNGLNLPIPERDVMYRSDVQPGTFQARDNVSNFITWCRKLDIKECLLFETDDLVLRKNEKSFILCLLEVARRGSKFGMPAPLLVQMEEEIDAELANGGSDCEDQEDSGLLMSSKPQVITNDLRSLHERVVDLLSRCTCPSQFPMIRVSEGKYRIGDSKILIFVRILRNHVMVRVGGGWDTLEHYLDKHDPCRCKSGHRFSTSAKLTMSPGKGSPSMQVTYNRSLEPNLSGVNVSNPRSHPSSPQTRRRMLTTNPPHRDSNGSSKDLSRISPNSGELPSSNAGDETSKLTRCLKPPHSDFIEFDETNGGERDKRSTPLKIMKMGDSGEEPVITVTQHECDLTNGFSSLPPEGDCKEITDRRISAPQVSKTPVHGPGVKITTPRLEGKSKIPYLPDHSVKALAINQKSPSSDNVYKPRVTQLNNCSPVHIARNGRRSSDSSNYLPDIRRSRSPSNDSLEDGLFLNRGSLGRHSYRSPRTSNIGPKVDTGYNTWAFRQRSPRPSLSSDLFRPPSAGSQSHARSLAPKTRTIVSNPKHIPQKKNPIKKPILSPDKVQKLLKDVDFDTDHDFLTEMEKFIESYKAKVEKKLKNEQLMKNLPDETPEHFPESFGALSDERPPSRGANPLQPSPPKSRSHSLGTSKIPMSIKYNKREW
ncbi:uncharacterized protein LOC106463671 [Limulus polyphemus]|uniref:Uncharacterized protein LOC106463671 n=1 Tax=Limulus polyphemus TaxID=6850 RepID=A0ABM1BCE6_LIMPO|nr:uncharacterized protein LOC106463671 [Limulus polyphemus]